MTAKGSLKIAMLLSCSICLYMIANALEVHYYMNGLAEASSKIDFTKLHKNNVVLYDAYGEFCSGSVVSGKGKLYILTAAHCCERYQEEETVPRYSYGENMYEGELVSDDDISTTSDLCAIRTNNKHSSYGMSSRWEEFGLAYFTTDFPAYAGGEFSESLIQIYGKTDILVDGDYADGRYVTGKYFPGMSGSPMFNVQGKVIGVLSASPIKPTLCPQGLAAMLSDSEWNGYQSAKEKFGLSK